MKLGIMQPYFFPYLGYFELIYRTDTWVIFDVVQYNTKSWMNRNRILHPIKGWQYITVPVAKAPRGTLIRDIRIKDKDATLLRILNQLDHYRKHAPYFKEVTDLVRRAFQITTSDKLLDLNVATLVETCLFLGITFDWSLCSKMDLDLTDIKHPGQWALKISNQLGAKEYINPPGGKNIFKPSEWEAAGILLTFTNPSVIEYYCHQYDFILNLSILDVLMWLEPEAIILKLQNNQSNKKI